MLRNRLVHLVAGLALVGLVACNGDDRQTQVEADTAIVTEPGTRTMEVEVPTEDTLLIEERVETTVEVDTTRVEGRDTVRRQ